MDKYYEVRHQHQHGKEKKSEQKIWNGILRVDKKESTQQKRDNKINCMCAMKEIKEKLACVYAVLYNTKMNKKWTGRRVWAQNLFLVVSILFGFGFFVLLFWFIRCLFICLVKVDLLFHFTASNYFLFLRIFNSFH